MIDLITMQSLFSDFEDAYEIRRKDNKNTNEDSTEKLLPCPICGNIPWVVKTKSDTYFIQCVNNCSLEDRSRKYYLTEKMAIKNWNKRGINE